MIEDLKRVQHQLPPCKPPVWARSGHLQTILGHLLPSDVVKEKGEQLHIPLNNESDLIHTTYLKGESRTIIYLFHGLGGSSHATYMQRTALMARKLGHHVFLNNHRGCGEGVGLATEPYHSGRSDDLSAVIAFGKKMHPDHRHIAIGFSLSANALLLLASGFRAEVLPDAAIAVNGPIELDGATILLTQGLNRIYDRNFVHELKKYVQQNNPAELKRLADAVTIRDFDEAYTAPLGGFKNRQDYYKTCSAVNYLNHIKIPTVLLTAADDPFVNVNDYVSAQLSPSTVLHIEKVGGHMGYLSQRGFGYERWMDHTLGAYLKVFEAHL